MDADAIGDLFADVMQVRCRRMFGGIGLFDGEQMFGLVIDGEIYLKTDAETVEMFRQAGSRPFTYVKQGKTQDIAYFLMPETAFDDPDELRRWSGLARDAARRAASSARIRRPAGSVRRLAGPR